MKHLLALIFLNAAFVFSVQGHNKIDVSAPIDSTKTYQIELRDGSEFVGNILSLDSAIMEIKTSSIPKIRISVGTIKKIRVIEHRTVIDGVTAIPNPYPTRYFFAPSAYNLAKGEKYYQNIDLLLHSVNIGLTDYFSFGAGIEFISTFATLGDDWSPIFFITPKVGFKVAENVNVGAGFLWVYLGPLDLLDVENPSLNMEYVLLTYGNKENNATLGISTTYRDGKFLIDNAPITISGMFRMGRKTSFLTENWIIPGEMGIYTYGVRFFGSKISVDLGFHNNEDIFRSIPIGVPYVDFVIKF